MDTPLFLNREIRLIYLAFILINLYNIPQGKKFPTYHFGPLKMSLYNGSSYVRQHPLDSLEILPEDRKTAICDK